MIEHNNRLPLYGAFLFATFVSLSLDSQLSLPYSSILRWVAPAFLWGLTLTRTKHLPLVKNRLFWIMLVWVGFTCIGSVNIPYSVERFISLVLICGAFYTYYTYLLKNGMAFDAVAMLGILYVIYGVVNFFSIQWGQERPTGFTGNANSLGGFGNIAMIFSVYYYHHAKRRKWIFVIIMILASVCSLLSASRSVAVCMLLIWVFAVVLCFKGKTRVIILVLLAFLAMGLLLAGGELLQSIPGMKRLMELGVVSEERVYMWEYGVVLVRQRPILGWGYGVSKTLNTIVQNFDFHNSYLSTAIETGLPGVALIVLFLLITLLRGYKLAFRFKKPELITILALLINFIIIFFGESSMMSVGSSEGFLFWGCVMWLLVIERAYYTGSHSSHRPFLDPSASGAKRYSSGRR